MINKDIIIEHERDLGKKGKKNFFLNKGGKLLKKLCCCVAKGVLQDNLVLSTELIM